MQHADKLIADYPELFEHPSCGVDYGEGWDPLIRRLCESLKPYPEVRVAQVKEKFGGLRFYVDFAPDEAYILIRHAETESFRICEVCGNPGLLRLKAWRETLCDGCAK